MLIALERLGSYLTNGGGHGLGKYREAIAEIGKRSSLAYEGLEHHGERRLRFSRQYELVRRGRNEAAHEGAAARHLVHHCLEVALILEDALMQECRLAGHYMVANPITASWWEPLSSIRQKMLSNSFSFLPVLASDDSGTWQLVSDVALARYLREDGRSSNIRATRLAKP